MIAMLYEGNRAMVASILNVNSYLGRNRSVITIMVDKKSAKPRTTITYVDL